MFKAWKSIKSYYNCIQYVQKVKWKHGEYKNNLFQTSKEENFSVYVENTLDRTNDRLNLAGKKISELQHMAVEKYSPVHSASVTLI